MRPRTADHSQRFGVLALVALLHVGLLWVLMNSSGFRVPVRIVSSLVRIIPPEKSPRTTGAKVKSPIITPSVLDLPKILPPKIVVMIQPSPTAPPAPAAAAATGSSAPTIGDRRPAPPPDDFSAYAKLLHNKLQATLNDISSRRVSQPAGAVTVDIEVDRSGQILVAQVEGEKHPAWMLYEISQMINQSNPLPPFPASIRAAKAAFAVPVTFDRAAAPF
jgi:hypothetical protein